MIPSTERRRALVWLLAGILLASPAFAIELPDSFVRIDSDGSAPRALQVALVQYVDASGRRLDLIGAVHVAEREYFATLERRFERYDALLYELVADIGERKPPEKQSASAAMDWVGLIQGGLKNLLGLSFQLEEIDYTAANFVHADLSPGELEAAMEARGESWLGTWLQLWAAAQNSPGAQVPTGGALLVMLLSNDRQGDMKRYMARALVEQLAATGTLGGERGSALITERNRKALQVLEQAIDAGAGSLGLFYGAAHMHDFHQQLVGKFGFLPVAIEWLDAWDLSAK